MTEEKKQIHEMPQWAKFDSYREMKVLADGKILVIRPMDTATVVPLLCPMCGFSMRTQYDAIAYRTDQACDKCVLFCRGNRNFMRTMEWKSYIEDRHRMPMSLIKLK